MKYINKVYLKSGIKINQNSNKNLADEAKHVEYWNRGSITLEGSNTVTIPRREVEIIDSQLSEVQID